MKLRAITGRLSAAAAAAILLIAFHGSAQTEHQAPPGWIADPKTGCKIWNAAPQPDESVRWSGSCKDGLADGQGTLQWIEKGQPDVRYDGEYHNGKRNGYGVVTDPNGNRIAGEWRDDEPVPLSGNEIDFIERR